ncbi:Aste57867_25222 [Aphanomyces stellatus]|uniref:Aste57867_25222 protein n=1 Tax=Aphanomyces stellatus TaxID=120398 RepID=A0A485LUZ0_9STRA|nr:hypothetical protein As57867_025144 [Aphanomyces stellatus]VFU01849.1 Aste57867_25222 [Aphanomyces stellatus]
MTPHPPASARTVHQTDFTASRGNALQACFASIFHLDLESVPNFIADPNGYMHAIDAWLAPQHVQFRKVNLTAEGTLPADEVFLDAGTLVVVRGKSPRGDHAHVVVGAVDATGRAFVPIMDPHPDSTFLDGVGQWVGLLQ